MNDAEFRRRILDALNEPVTEQQQRDYGVQCAEHLDYVYMARIRSIVATAARDEIRRRAD